MKLQKQYVDWAAELGFEYNLICDGWQDCFTKDKAFKDRDPWDLMKEVVDYARGKGVKILVWEHAKDIIMSIPTLWEKTIVLEPSDPGKLAAIARFDGKNWFIGVMNGEKTSKEITIDLGFLGSDLYDAVLVGDDSNGDPLIFDRKERQGVKDNEKLTIQLSQGGGYVARFTPVK